MSSASPKLSGSNLISVKSRSGDSFTVMCPAQGFPVPSYRLVLGEMFGCRKIVMVKK